MKVILYVILSITLFLTGCAVTTSRKTDLTPPNSDVALGTIHAECKGGAISDKIILFIDNKKIASGFLSPMNSRLNLSAIYEGKKIDARCAFDLGNGGLTLDHRCVIYIDNTMTTELVF